MAKTTVSRIILSLLVATMITMGLGMISIAHATYPGPIKITKAEYSKKTSKLTVKYKITKKNTKPIRIEIANPKSIGAFYLMGKYKKKGKHTYTQAIALKKPSKKGYTCMLYNIDGYFPASKTVKWVK